MVQTPLEIGLVVEGLLKVKHIWILKVISHKLQFYLLCKTLILIFGYFDVSIFTRLAAYAVRGLLLKNEKEDKK